MKKSALLLIPLLFSFIITGYAQDAQSEEPLLNDKEFLLNYFQETTDNLQKSIAGLSKEQLQFKPSEDRWSVSQCIEHIILTENMLFEMAKEVMDKPANPERRKEVKISDEDLIAGMRDRTQKATAAEELQGEGSYTDPETAMQDFIEQREEVLEYIRNTTLEDLRSHISDLPFGAVDAYQSFLFIAGHSDRHTLQVEEVKSAKGFPTE